MPTFLQHPFEITSMGTGQWSKSLGEFRQETIEAGASWDDMWEEGEGNTYTFSSSSDTFASFGGIWDASVKDHAAKDFRSTLAAVEEGEEEEEEEEEEEVSGDFVRRGNVVMAATATGDCFNDDDEEYADEDEGAAWELMYKKYHSGYDNLAVPARDMAWSAKVNGPLELVQDKSMEKYHQSYVPDKLYPAYIASMYQTQQSIELYGKIPHITVTLEAEGTYMHLCENRHQKEEHPIPWYPPTVRCLKPTGHESFPKKQVLFQGLAFAPSLDVDLAIRTLFRPPHDQYGGGGLVMKAKANRTWSIRDLPKLAAARKNLALGNTNEEVNNASGSSTASLSTCITPVISPSRPALVLTGLPSDDYDESDVDKPENKRGIGADHRARI